MWCQHRAGHSSHDSRRPQLTQATTRNSEFPSQRLAPHLQPREKRGRGRAPRVQLLQGLRRGRQRRPVVQAQPPLQGGRRGDVTLRAAERPPGARQRVLRPRQAPDESAGTRSNRQGGSAAATNYFRVILRFAHLHGSLWQGCTSQCSHAAAQQVGVHGQREGQQRTVRSATAGQGCDLLMRLLPVATLW